MAESGQCAGLETYRETTGTRKGLQVQILLPAPFFYLKGLAGSNPAVGVLNSILKS